MFLQYINDEGKLSVVPLEGRTSTSIGRAPEADICIADAKVSRIHTEIRPWGDDYVIKDLDSRNGTIVNGSRIEIAVLRPGDTVRIGSHDFTVRREAKKGTRTIVREVTQEADEGKKGYRTMLREIVQSTAPERKS
jgi:pSer/pThr/pTyr-binding forkhead associated (FHA) protein